MLGDLAQHIYFDDMVYLQFHKYGRSHVSLARMQVLHQLLSIAPTAPDAAALAQCR